MNRPELIDAFNDSVAWLQSGATLEACLARYPELADELRPLLETAQHVGRSRAGALEVRQAQARVRAHVLAELNRAPAPARRRAWPVALARLAVAATLVLVLAAVFAGREPILNFLQGRTPTASFALTLTPVDVSTVTPETTATATATETPTPIPTTPPTATLEITASLTSATITPQGACLPALPEGWATYTVQPGDSLSRLASLSGQTVAELQRVNCLEDSLLVVGETLYVPQAALPALMTSPPPASTGGTGSGAPTNDSSPSTGGTSGGSANDNDSDDDDDDDDDDNDDDDD